VIEYVTNKVHIGIFASVKLVVVVLFDRFDHEDFQCGGLETLGALNFRLYSVLVRQELVLPGIRKGNNDTFHLFSYVSTCSNYLQK
jgi:hypothetical protein